jgi:signal transduction histidine kinase
MGLAQKNHLLKQQIDQFLKEDSKKFENFLQAVEATYDQFEKDMSQLRLELDEAKALIEKANKTKRDFLANMSHELRTPLNVIIGYSEMLADELKEGRDTQVMQEDVDKIYKAGKHLLTLIEEILALTYIESGKLDLVIKRLDMKAFLDEITLVAESFMQEKQNAFFVHIEQGVSTLETDEAKLRQILLNLLSNAAKYTVKGEVRLSVFPEMRNGEPWVIFQIKDSGIGISQERLAHIFTYFSHGNDGKELQGGAGIGLAISERFCTVLGGEINVESIKDSGSIFTVKFPLSFHPTKKRHLYDLIRYESA